MAEDRDVDLIKAFRALGDDSPRCLRLFARGASTPGCCILGYWAGVASRDYIKSSAVMKNWGDGAHNVLEVVFVNDALSKEMIRDCLLRRGAAVEYYERATGGAGERGSTSGGSVHGYTCVRRGTPGNIADFEATLFEFEESEIQLMASGALVLADTSSTSGSSGGKGGDDSSSGVRVGFAVLNSTLRHIAFAEYIDVVQLTNLDALIAQTNLKELTLYLPKTSSSVLAAGTSGSRRGQDKSRRYTDGNQNDDNIDDDDDGGRSAARRTICDERIRAVQRICTRAGTNFHLRVGRPSSHASSSQPSNALDALRDILRIPEERLALLHCPDAMLAMQHLLASVDLCDAYNHRTFYLRHITPNTFMKLDTAAIEALHLVSSQPEPRGTLPRSVFTWLNRCCTGMGARTMRQWLLQPLCSVDDIAQRQTMVEIMVEHPALREGLTVEVLKKCSDMDRLNRKLQRRALGLKDTQAFLSLIRITPITLQLLRSYKGQHTKMVVDEYVAPLEDIYEHMGNLKMLIEATVDFSDRHVARINPDFDDDLQELHTQLQRVRRGVEKEYQRILQDYDWSEKQLKYEYHNSYGYVFRVSRKEDHQVRVSKELRTVSTSKDGVRFVSDAMAALSEQYRCVNEDYLGRQQSLKNKLIDTIASYLPILDDCKEIIAALDVFVAWALVVKDSPRAMTRPTVVDTMGGGDTGKDGGERTYKEGPSLANRQSNDASPQLPPRDGGDDTNTYSNKKSDSDAYHQHHHVHRGVDGKIILSMKNVRHPLVELRQPAYMANSVHLTSDVNGMIITGPNMGGKSTYMRSVGVAVILAQAGCFVPADAATVCVRDAVMCRVGATDHLAQGVSTFMVEMLESAAILSAATPRTLCIIDELGRGTSTYDGFGLAWAIAKEVAVSVRATLLFSTHFHEMTKLASQFPCVQNFHFGADIVESTSAKSGAASAPTAQSSGGDVANSGSHPRTASPAAGRTMERLCFSYKLESGPCGRSYGLYVAELAQMPDEVVARARVKAAELERFDEGVRGDGEARDRATEEMNAEAEQRLAQYALRVRCLENIHDEEERKEARQRLREEIARDEVVRTMLSS